MMLRAAVVLGLASSGMVCGQVRLLLFPRAYALVEYGKGVHVYRGRQECARRTVVL